MSILKKVTKTGIEQHHSHPKKRAIRLTNFLSIILTFCITLLYTIRSVVYSDVEHGLRFDHFVLGVMLFMIPILLNKLKLTNVSRIFLCYLPVCFLWFIHFQSMNNFQPVEVSRYDNFRIFLLVFSFVPYLILDMRKWGLLFLAVLPTLISVLFFDQITSWIGIGHEQVGVPSLDYQLMQMRGLIAYIIVSSACFSFQSIIYQSDNYNKKIMKTLKDQSDEIEAQNEELVQGQERLNEMNAHLEELVLEKTKNIQLQNRVLTQYAYSNAHHVRGPVARLLGLIELTKIDKNDNFPLLLKKIEEESLELDRVIKEVSANFNDIDTQDD